MKDRKNTRRACATFDMFSVFVTFIALFTITSPGMCAVSNMIDLRMSEGTIAIITCNATFAISQTNEHETISLCFDPDFDCHADGPAAGGTTTSNSACMWS
eukprot:m.169860 g.169860  ORF g.169860 m.169860 type:complete len:101 (+) comp31590_c0_seq4:2291-2593(+)